MLPHKVQHLPHDLIPLILWELFELGFRRELLAMDRHFRPEWTREQEAQREELLSRIFPSQSIYAVVSLPTTHSSGLFAHVPQRRIDALNAFREVLMRWTGCSETVARTLPLGPNACTKHIEDVEQALAAAYVTQFFLISGRAPLVPHLSPTLPDG